MDATLQSLAYRKSCEHLGELLSDYGRQIERIPATVQGLRGLLETAGDEQGDW